MLKTVDNFQGVLEPKTKTEIKRRPKNFGYQGFAHFTAAKKKFLPIHISFADYKSKMGDDHESYALFDWLGHTDKRSDDELILSVSQSSAGGLLARTGNYVGKFTWGGIEVDIRSRFPNVFLKRMLNVANDVFLDDVAAFDAAESKDLDVSKFIIYYMFVQKLEKAFLLGLPKAYRTIEHHEMKVKGRIDVNRFIKHDIPFQGKVSSVSREQQEVQEIIDVLFKAVQVIAKHEQGLLKNIRHIQTHLKQYKSNQYVSPAMIQKAMSSKALQNPVFSSYKSVLEYAKLIIEGSNLEEKNNGKEKTFGFLVNVAELFELYVTKLLQKEFPDWDVSSPNLVLENEFGDSSYLYKRQLIPDIVMKHRSSDRVMVFDTKYKRMKFGENKFKRGDDVDRNDFFQINTYMNFYNNQDQYDLIAGGLFYPIEAEFNEAKCHCSSWLGNHAVKFVVDGIDLSKLSNATVEDEMKDEIIHSEEKFIDRVKLMGKIRDKKYTLASKATPNVALDARVAI